jgi:hypothetical protein
MVMSCDDKSKLAALLITLIMMVRISHSMCGNLTSDDISCNEFTNCDLEESLFLELSEMTGSRTGEDFSWASIKKAARSVVKKIKNIGANIKKTLTNWKDTIKNVGKWLIDFTQSMIGKVKKKLFSINDKIYLKGKCKLPRMLLSMNRLGKMIVGKDMIKSGKKMCTFIAMERPIPIKALFHGFKTKIQRTQHTKAITKLMQKHDKRVESSDFFIEVNHEIHAHVKMVEKHKGLSHTLQLDSNTAIDCMHVIATCEILDAVHDILATWADTFTQTPATFVTGGVLTTTGVVLKTIIIAIKLFTGIGRSVCSSTLAHGNGNEPSEPSSNNRRSRRKRSRK